jgi:hypothetical protein
VARRVGEVENEATDWRTGDRYRQLRINGLWIGAALAEAAVSRRAAIWPAEEDAERRKADWEVEKSRLCCWDSRRMAVDVKRGCDMSEYVQESLSSRDGETKVGLSIIASFHPMAAG